MAEREEVLLEHAFVLHQRAYRNTSQLIDCVTATHGRVALVAQGSKRGIASRRALLQPFIPLTLSWVRRGDLGRLTHVEATAASHDLGADALLAGFYINELLLRLTARGDPNAEIFSCYSRCLAALAERAKVARTVRLFELQLLRALGYGLELAVDVDSGAPLQADSRYLFELERGPRKASLADGHDEVYTGHELMSLRDETLADEASLRAAHRLLARVLRVYLGDRPLQSRLVLQDIVRRGL
jgi:DNA repair protein RecO (recombination protein O)